MKQKFKFKVLDYRGRVKLFIREFDCPNFEVLPAKKWRGLDLPSTSIESQLMTWMDEQDKSALIIDNNWAAIIDYWIPVKVMAKPTIGEYLKGLNLDEQTVLDLLAVYQEIKPLLKGKPVEAQVKIMFSHLSIGHKAATNAYRHITEVLRSTDTENSQLTLQE